MSEKNGVYTGMERGEYTKASGVVDIREHWQKAPDVPLAWQDPDDLITSESFHKWRGQLNALKKAGINIDGTKQYEGYILASELLAEYKKLHFLSEANAREGMRMIADDINKNFDPLETLIILEGGSVRFFYGMVKDKLSNFGTFRERGRQGMLEILDQNGYKKGKAEDAKTWLYLDDWILTGEQFGSSTINLAKNKSQFFPYFLVVSDRGKYIFDKAGINGKCVYKVKGDDSPQSFFGTFPIYGFHKIPDRLPDIYAGSAKHNDPDYSIFPEVDGYAVGRHSRLIQY